MFAHILFPLSGTLVLFPFCLLAVEKSLGIISISFCLDSSQCFALFSYFLYHHTCPGAWRNLLCFPILGAGGRLLVPGLLASNKPNDQGNFSHSSLWRWGQGHSTLWVSCRYTQLWSSQAFPHGPAGPTPQQGGMVRACTFFCWCSSFEGTVLEGFLPSLSHVKISPKYSL